MGFMPTRCLSPLSDFKKVDKSVESGKNQRSSLEAEDGDILTKNKDIRIDRTRSGKATGKGELLKAMQEENLKLQKRIAKLEAQLVTARNRITVLEKERSTTGLEKLSDAELEERIRAIEGKREHVKK
jgi:hypothetical protein